MQIGVRKRVGFLQGIAFAVLCSLVLLAGCSSDAVQTVHFAPTDTLRVSPDNRAAALEALDAMERTAFDTAVTHLQGHAFSRYVRTEQVNDAGYITGYRERVLAYQWSGDDPSFRLVRSDSAGAFDMGALSRFADVSELGQLPTDLSRLVLPEEPAFLAPRTREAFAYRLRPDTLLGTTPVQIVEVQARPTSEGDDQGIRYARLYLSADTNQLIAIKLVRAERTALFSEDSLFFVRLQENGEGTWVPHTTRFWAIVNIPFRGPLQFRTVSSYYDIQSLG